MNIRDLLDDLDFRVNGLCADLRVYLVIRSENRQHKEDGLGGGNIAMSIVLFSILGFLAKLHYFVINKGQVSYDKHGSPCIDEERAFVDMVRAKSALDLNLGIETESDEVIGDLWHNFRDHLVHSTTVGAGNQMSVYLIDPELKKSLDEILDLMKPRPSFEKSTGWRLNPDNLLAKVPTLWSSVRQDIETMKLDIAGLAKLKKLVR